MPAYANAGGNSNVVWYDFDPADDTWIVVTFAGGKARNYRYTAASCGLSAVRTMIGLAQAGQGLNSFISRRVRQGYERRW
jgi:hypothetical protein